MNAYVHHLASVNEMHDVIAITDIYDAQGNVLLKGGSRLDAEAVDRIAEAELQKPLALSVKIQSEFNATTLFRRFQLFVANDSAVSFLQNKYDYDADLKALSEWVCSFTVLRQNLSVLAIVLPKVFEQAIFCAWFGGLVCTISNNSVAATENVFMAALCQDIGMLYLCPEALKKKGQLSLADWNQIQSHASLGANVIKDIQEIDKVVVRALMEHHEQLDGTGYPRGLVGSQLGNDGQLINLLGSINAIYTKHFKPFNRSLSGLIPIIQMNQQSHYGALADQLIIVLQSLPEHLHTDMPHHLAADVITVTQARCDYILRCVDICADLTSAIGFRHNDLKLASIQNAIIHISMSITSAGIINDAYMLWLEQVAAGQLIHAYPEVEEAFLMMREIIYHISRLERKLQKYLLKSESGAYADLISTQLQRLEETILPQTPESLVDIWMSRE